MNIECGICAKAITGDIHLEGVTTVRNPRKWVWGPVAVHEPCRVFLATPYDAVVGDGEYRRTWDVRTMEAV